MAEIIWTVGSIMTVLDITLSILIYYKQKHQTKAMDEHEQKNSYRLNQIENFISGRNQVPDGEVKITRI